MLTCKEFSALYFSVPVCKSMIRMCDALAYHMEGAEKHLNLISALYNSFKKALPKFKNQFSVYLHSSISNMSLYLSNKIIKITKNGEIKFLK